MICPNCGKEVTGYTGVCEFCGTNIAQDPAGTATNSAGNGKLPKKAGGKKKLLILIPILAVLALVVVLVVVNAAYISNAIKKATLSPEAYCQYVLKKNFADHYVASDLYDTHFYQRWQSRKDMSFSGEIALQLSDDAIDLLEDVSGTDMADALEDLRLNYEQQVKNDQYAFDLKLSSGKDSIISGKLILDGDEKVAYGIVPELNKDYAKVDLEAMAPEDELEKMNDLLKGVDKMAESYPEPKALREMHERYFNLLVDELDDVKESSEKLSIEGITQSCTVLTIRLDEDQLGRIIIAMCEEAAEDEMLEETANTMTEALRLMGSDDEDFWEQMKERLDEAKESAEDLNLNGAEYEIRLYVSGKGNIQGMDYTFVNDDTDEAGRFYFAYVTKGNDIAMEGSIENSNSRHQQEVTVEGKGTLALGKLNADVQVSGDADVDFRLENVDIAGLKKGHISGDLVLEMKQFKSALSNLGLKDLKDQTLTISLDMSEKSNGFEIRLAEDKDMFASLSMSGKYGNAGKIDIPADSKCEEITDEDEMQDYIDDCDTDELQDKLEDLGLESLLGTSAAVAGNVNSNINYINQSKISADTMLADSVHTAVLTSMFDPEIVNRKEYNEDFKALTTQTDITQYTGTEEENVILWGVGEIMGVEDLHELSDQIHSSGATGRILVTITGNSSVEVVLEGTDDGYGSEITIRN